MLQSLKLQLFSSKHLSLYVNILRTERNCRKCNDIALSSTVQSGILNAVNCLKIIFWNKINRCFVQLLNLRTPKSTCTELVIAFTHPHSLPFQLLLRLWFTFCFSEMVFYWFSVMLKSCINETRKLFMVTYEGQLWRIQRGAGPACTLLPIWKNPGRGPLN